jgi:Subtilase family/PatG C-terminal/PatG Domain
VQNVVSSLPGLAELWQETLGASEICVVMLDGPVDLAHACFKGTLLKESLPTSSRNRAVQPLSTHGTHVASVIFGQHEGPVPGVAPNCKGVYIPVYKEDDRGELIPCCQTDLARAISQALQEGAHVINISGGELTPTGEAQTFLANAVRQCADQNVLIVAATGNDGGKYLHVPATLPSVLAVGAANADGLPMEFSNWGEPMASQGILAPGENISGAVPNNGVGLKTGTSFATPIVTGVAALLLSLQKQRGEKPNPQAVREALLASAIPAGADEPDQSRRMLVGRLNIPCAYARLFQKPLASSAKMVRQAEKSYHNLQEEGINMSDETTQVANQVSTGICQEAASTHQAAIQPQGMEAQQPATNVQASSEPLSSVPQTPQPAAPAPGYVTASGQSGSAFRPSQTAVDTSQLEDLLSGFRTSKNSKLVYSVAEIGYDFGTEARKDYFTQQFYAIRQEIESDTPVGKELLQYFAAKGADEINENNFKAFGKYLFQTIDDIKMFPLATNYLQPKAADSNAVIWTLNLDATPIYAIRPINQFAVVIYRYLAEFLYDAVVYQADHVSVGGFIIGDIKLYNGQVVPKIDPSLRGMFNWNTAAIVKAVLGDAPQKPDEKAPKKVIDAYDIYLGEHEGITNFLNRIYYQLRNLGQSPQDRAMNYFATNAYQAKQVFQDVLIEAKTTGQKLELDTITAEVSPICRPESECYDVVLQFFNPLKRIEQARKVYRQTVDVSDIVPVSVGEMRTWYIY